MIRKVIIEFGLWSEQQRDKMPTAKVHVSKYKIWTFTFGASISIRTDNTDFS